MSSPIRDVLLSVSLLMSVTAVGVTSAMAQAPVRLAQTNPPAAGATTSPGTPAGSTATSGRSTAPAGGVGRPVGAATSGTGQNSGGSQGIGGKSSTGSSNSPR